MKRIMFVCNRNARRSQMAEGFAHELSPETLEVTSAGLQQSSVDPLAIEVMQEVGIDISHHTSKPLADFDPESYDAVISLCGCGVNLPPDWLTRDIFEDWELDDPAGESIETFRRIRDEVREKVQILLSKVEA